MIKRLAEFARTRGAKDKRRRRRRGEVLTKDAGTKRLKNIELGTRSAANLGRALNSVTRSVEQARITAKYFGIDPRNSQKALMVARNVGSGVRDRRQDIKGGLSTINSGLLGLGRARSLFL